MIVTILGSSTFAKQMYDHKLLLEKQGHIVNLHEHYIAQAQGRGKELQARMRREHAAVKIEYDYIRYHYDEILNSDAVLVLNLDMNGIANYIGGNTLIEIAQAYIHNKKIFLLNPIPQLSYTDEIIAMMPVIINGDLNMIN